jgi:hypothetical protein
MDLIQVEVHDAGARASQPGAFVCLSLCESLVGNLQEEDGEREEDERLHFVVAACHTHTHTHTHTHMYICACACVNICTLL